MTYRQKREYNIKNRIPIPITKLELEEEIVNLTKELHDLYRIFVDHKMIYPYAVELEESDDIILEINNFLTKIRATDFESLTKRGIELQKEKELLYKENQDQSKTIIELEEKLTKGQSFFKKMYKIN